MLIRKRKPGDIISINCSSCDGRGWTPNRPLGMKTDEEFTEEELLKIMVSCPDCNGTGKIQGVIQSGGKF